MGVFNLIWTSTQRKSDFYDTLKILTNVEIMNPVFLELKKFIENTFNIKALNITIEKFGFFDRPKKSTYLYGKQYKLVIHVSSYSEREIMQNRVSVKRANFPNAHKMVNDEIKQNLILDKFIEQAEKHNFKNKINKSNTFADYYYWFTTDYAQVLLDRVEKDLTSQILNEFQDIASIWRIERSFATVTIFYQTESDKAANDQSGLTKKIKDIYLSSIKLIDSIDLFKEDYIVFDSKENINDKYGGNLCNYFR